MFGGRAFFKCYLSALFINDSSLLQFHWKLLVATSTSAENKGELIYTLVCTSHFTWESELTKQTVTTCLIYKMI